MAMRDGRSRFVFKLFATLITVATTVVGLAASASAQIVFDTAPWDGKTDPTSTADAITLFDSEPSGQTGYGCFALLTTMNGACNQRTLRGTQSDIAYHVAIAFSVSSAQTGAWSFRWGPDLGGGGTMLVDGVELASKWGVDIYWNNSFSDPSQIIQGTTSLAAGNHTIDLYGFETCCDGTTDAQFLAPGSTVWLDISTANLALLSAGACSGPAAFLNVSASPNPVLAGSQLTYTLSYEEDGTAAVASAALVAALPLNTTFVSASAAGSFSASTNEITWSLGDLAVGSSGQVTATVNVAPGTAGGTVLATTTQLTGTGAQTQIDVVKTTVQGVDGGAGTGGGAAGGAGGAAGGAAGGSAVGGAGGAAGGAGAIADGGAADAGGAGGAAGAGGGAVVIADAGALDAGAGTGGAAGAGGAAGGAAGSKGAAGQAGGMGGAKGGASGSPGGGCSCAVGDGPATAGLLGLMPLVSLLLLARRRRTRRI
jgi:MYXO-CTERM domain-containing protein/uncharacterized repeat protein (TIGR01451 family)